MSIEAMKLAVENMEWSTPQGREAYWGLVKAIAEAENQEPVGWIDSKGNMICTKINESCKPFYTTPQQRTWVELTNEEMLDCLTPLDAEAKRLPLGFKWFAQAIEAKLKDKNL